MHRVDVVIDTLQGADWWFGVAASAFTAQVKT